MEKEIKITIPEGYDDVVYNEQTKSLTFIKKDTRPKSWAEYCKKGNHPDIMYELDCVGAIGDLQAIGTQDLVRSASMCTSQQEAEAFRALMQLRCLRKAWIKDWEPDWEDSSMKYPIYRLNDGFSVVSVIKCPKAFSFPTRKMAEEFLECFKDLFEIAKELI